MWHHKRFRNPPPDWFPQITTSCNRVQLHVYVSYTIGLFIYGRITTASRPGIPDEANVWPMDEF